METYFLGIDLGTQSCKLAIYSATGKRVAQSVASLLPIEVPKQGQAIHPGDNLWEAFCQAARELTSRWDKTITAAALTVQRCCRVLLTKDLELAQPVISWMDERLGRPYEHQPGVDYVTTAGGYLAARLTGEKKDSVANYFGHWPYSEQEWVWSSDDQDYLQNGLKPGQLFSLVGPGQLLGVLTKEAALQTGLSQGLPIVATGNDKAVDMLAVDPSANSMMVSLGTYIAAAVLSKEELPGQAYWKSFSVQPPYFLYETVGVRRGMWTISWFLRELAGENSLQEINNEASAISLGSDGLMAIHDWAAPVSEPHKRGALVGFDGRHGKAHIFRAILEGIAFRLANNWQDACAHKKLEINSLYSCGGGSHSELLNQMLANVYQLPLSTFEETFSLTALCGALLAATWHGSYSNIQEAREAMIRTGSSYQPVKSDQEQVAAFLKKEKRLSQSLGQALGDNDAF